MTGPTRRSILIASLAAMGSKAFGQEPSIDIDISELAIGETFMRDRGGKRLSVRRLAEDDFLVLDTRCTHLGCPVTAIASTGFAFRCFCHGSQFAADGTVLRGPAKRPLLRHAWKKVSRNTIRVFLSAE